MMLKTVAEGLNPYEITKEVFVTKDHNGLYDTVFVDKKLIGNWIISTIIHGERFSKTFFFYSLDEAIFHFQISLEGSKEGIY